ncbi:hypothetical protein D3C87_1977700 [compost metagenome]
MASTWKLSVSTTATSPASGIDTYKRLSLLLATQSMGARLSGIRLRVLVMPPTEIEGSITEILGSLFSSNR